MGIRSYEFNQAKRAYDESVSRAMRQQSFNELAEQAALVDQDRLYHEQLIGLALDETETLFNYGAAAAGIGLKKRQAKAAAVTTSQEAKVSAIKAAGASLASGAFGRSAAANIQGIVAESGTKQAAIVDIFLFNTEATDQDMMRLNGEFLMDQVGFEFSRDSAKLSDMATRSKIKAQALQAALDAHASIQLKPEIGPALPKPFALPRPEFQPVYKQGKPPEPMKARANTENLFAAFATETVNKVAMAASMGAFGGVLPPACKSTQESVPQLVQQQVKF